MYTPEVSLLAARNAIRREFFNESLGQKTKFLNYLLLFV